MSYQHTGTVVGAMPSVEAIKMSVDEDAVAHLLAGMSSNLYADGHRAVLREYVSNALDSHVRAGQTRPVEVTLPTALNPTLVIQDFGVGLSRDEVRSMFSKFGGSDKRSVDAERGGFGLGAKSALSITAQYTFWTVKDGCKDGIVVSMDDDGIPVMHVITSSETDEHDGVTVIIPVGADGIISLNTHIEDGLFATLKPGSILVDGKEPGGLNVHDAEQFTAITEPDGEVLGWWMHHDVRNTARHGLSIDILGVHYSVPNGVKVDAQGIDLSRVWLSVPDRAVQMATSRDSLVPTPATARAIQATYGRFRERLLVHVRDSIARATTASEALAVWRNRPTGAGAELPVSWRGEALPLNDKEPLWWTTTVVGRDAASSKPVDEICTDKDYVYVSVEPGNVSRAQNAARVLRTEANRLGRAWVPHLIAPTQLGAQSTWVQASCIELSYQAIVDQAREVRRANRANAPQGNARKKTPVRQVTVFTSAEAPYLTWERVPSDTLSGKKLCYVRPNRPQGLEPALTVTNLGVRGRGYSGSTAQVVRAVMERGYTLVSIPGNVKADCLGDAAIPADDVLKGILADLLDDAKDELFAIGVSESRGWKTLRKETKRERIDPEQLTSDVVRLVTQSPEPTVNMTLLRALGKYDERALDLFERAKAVIPAAPRLPLLEYWHSHISQAHITDYINAVTDGRIRA